MAQNQQSITCKQGVWTQLTNSNVTEITFQPLIGETYIRYTTDDSPPTESLGVVYRPTKGALREAISDLTSLVGAVRVWGKPTRSANSLVYVDHE